MLKKINQGLENNKNKELQKPVIKILFIYEYSNIILRLFIRIPPIHYLQAKIEHN